MSAAFLERDIGKVFIDEHSSCFRNYSVPFSLFGVIFVPVWLALGRCHQSLQHYSLQHHCFPRIITELLQTGPCLAGLLFTRIWTQSMCVKGRNLSPGLCISLSAHQHSHESSLLRHYRRRKMCKHKHALKGKWLGVHRTQVFLTQSWSRSNSAPPLGSPLFISHMACSLVLLTQDTERDAEKTIRGHEHGTSLGKTILKVPLWQWWKAHAG